MTYLDDVRGKGLLSNAWFNAVLLLLVTLLLYSSDLRGTGLAKLLAPAIDNNVDAGVGARIILAAFFETAGR